MTLALLTFDGMSVSTLISVCTTLVFPLVGYIWWQMHSSKVRLWTRLDEANACIAAAEKEMAILKYRTEIIESDKKGSVTLIDIRNEIDKMKNEIEAKIDKSKQEYIEIVKTLLAKNKGDA